MWVRPDILYVQITGVIPESIEENTYKRYTYPEVPTQKYLPTGEPRTGVAGVTTQVPLNSTGPREA